MGKPNKHSSALSNKEGVVPVGTMNPNAASQLKKSKQKTPNTNQLVNGILAGNKTSLSRAITLTESLATKHKAQARAIIKACLPHVNKSVRIGITGVPGVGKSTFIESFGQLLIAKGKKVAVLAVDPSSSLSSGSILGDKTRMESLVKEPNAFIRPSASGTTLGGVARKTRETILLCEAAGYDAIIIETVGVGQSETAVHSMTDFFLLLKLAGAGDELQGIKRGIMEMADAIVINKADGENQKAAKLAKTEFNRALHLYPAKDNGWTPKTLTCSALHNQGIEEVYQVIKHYLELGVESNSFQEQRNNQNKYWLLQTIESSLKEDFFASEKVQKALELQLQKIENQETTPFQAAEVILKLA